MPETLPTGQLAVRAPAWRRGIDLLRPSRSHTAFTATLLLMLSVTLSRVIGLVRVKYIAYLFGRGAAADAFNAAFQLPDMISYFLVGGAASITFVTMLTRYRESGREEEGREAMSVILTTMLCVLGAAIVLAEFFAPVYVRALLSGFDQDPAKLELCVHLTRILLVAPLFFFSGGVFGAVLLVRKQFTVQAISPLIYNLGTILGGVFLAKTIGVSSLAIGTVAGAFCGPFLLNAIGAHRLGMKFRPKLDWQNAGLRQWVRMSVPLMLGVSLVTADNWIINYFASHNGGAISLLTYAKNLFTAPVALGQAAGAASLPFLASLYGQENDSTGRDVAGFSRAVDSSVSRILAFSLLLSAWMIAMARPAVDVVFRGGVFHRADASTMAVYFAVFSVSLCLWSAQALYARAFYAAGNTLTPMIAGTIVTVVSLPVYWSLYRSNGPVGLAAASDIGILIQTLTLAVLLHRRRMVSIAELEFGELLRALLAAAVSLALLHEMVHMVPAHSRIHELGLLIIGSALWLATAGLVLRLTGSRLPGQLLARFRK